jgi:glucose-1-phosphate thymidylyltransferase
MEIAKALILAEHGGDDNPWPTAPRGPKHLFPIANRPILFHNLEALRSAGLLEAAILASGPTAMALRQAVGDGRDWGLHLEYAEWRPGGGLSGALAASREFVGDEPVLVQQGGALLEPMQAHISAFAREELDALALCLPRPAPPAGYLFSPRAFSILLAGGEVCRDPMDHVRARGGRVRVQPVDGCVPCHGDVETLLESNRRMLEGLTASFDPALLEGSTVQGPVHIHPGARIQRSLLRGPAIIGPGARLTDAYIGPYTSIGAGVLIEGAEIEHSIVLAEAELRFLGTRLESSIIGRGARIIRGFDLPGALRMSIGDGAQVVLR